MHNPIIMASGLPGTGKTSSTIYLEERLDNFDRYGTNETRRKLGFKRYSASQIHLVLQDMYGHAISSIIDSRGVILEANYKTSRGRQIVYDIASDFSLNVLVIEYICSEKEAKRRMRNRQKNDGLVTSPRDPKVYDKVKGTWEDIAKDLMQNQHVSLIRFDTERNLFEEVRINPCVSELTEKVKEALLEHSKRYTA